jgi:hypothetical protein
MRMVTGDALTYREAWNVSELLGAHLIERSEGGELSRSEPIAVFGSVHPLVLSCCFACAKSGHPYRRIDDSLPGAIEETQQFALVLAASTDILAPELEAQGVRLLDAHRIRTYIVPGMTDDFSCGCGMQDCTHGPFLQECSPTAWLADDEIFAIESDHAITVSEHDIWLVNALEGRQSTAATLPPFSLFPNLADPFLAALIAQGKEVPHRPCE